MGTPITRKRDPEYHPDEAPLKVEVDDFRIGKYPVTAKQMCDFLNSTWAKSHDRSTLYSTSGLSGMFTTVIRNGKGNYDVREGADNAPANQVTWLGAVLYCRWLSEVSNREYRLPTEAEWELAARGSEGRVWPWGDAPLSAKPGALYPERATSKMVPVGTRPENATPDGVYDFLAYVIGEWCINKYVARPTPEQANNKVLDIEDLETNRVVRGYYHRLKKREITDFMSWFVESVGHHPGRTWTRVGCHPIDEVQQAARHGFRVVEVVAVDEESVHK